MVQMRPRTWMLGGALMVICMAWPSANYAADFRTVTFSKGLAAMALANVHDYELVEGGAVLVISSPEAAEAKVRFSFRRLTEPVFEDRTQIDELVCIEAERKGADCWEVTKTQETFFYGNAQTAITDQETFILVQGMRSARDGVFTYSLQFPERRLADEDYNDRPLDLLTELIESVYRIDE